MPSDLTLWRVDLATTIVIVRQHPLEAIHAHAFGAAVAAICAGRQGKFRT